MSEYFGSQQTIVAFNGTALTNAYTGNRFTFQTGGFTKLSIDASYAMGAAETANTMELQLEHSPDNGANWYKLVIDTTATASTITPREWTMAPDKLNVILDIAYKTMRISLKESGVATNAGTASVSLTLSGL